MGNTSYPLIERKPSIKIQACDFSATACKYGETHELYDPSKIQFTPVDLATENLPSTFKSADYACLIFVLSAIKPENHLEVLSKIAKSLKPGGILYFRDYAELDMVQLRYASKKKYRIEGNLYIRPDSTLNYFFSKEELENLFKKAGFELKLSRFQQRIIENRKRKIKMHRNYLQIRAVRM